MGMEQASLLGLVRTRASEAGASFCQMVSDQVWTPMVATSSVEISIPDDAGESLFGFPQPVVLIKATTSAHA
jgi:hypothetical protein